MIFTVRVLRPQKISKQKQCTQPVSLSLVRGVKIVTLSRPSVKIYRIQTFFATNSSRNTTIFFSFTANLHFLQGAFFLFPLIKQGRLEGHNKKQINIKAEVAVP